MCLDLGGFMNKFGRVIAVLLTIAIIFAASPTIVISENEYLPIVMETFNDHTYAVFDLGMTWHEAKAYCESLGGHLVTITSQAEQDFIESLISSGAKNFYWLGGTDEEIEGIWEWITYEEWNYSNWEDGRPDNLSGHDGSKQDYLGVWAQNSFGDTFGKWDDISAIADGNSRYWGLNLSGFICEWSFANLDGPRVILDKKELIFDQSSIIENDRALVPIRVISEAMGANVDYDDNTQTITITEGNTVVKLQIGSSDMTVNRKVVKLDVAPKSVNGRTLVPVRAISEAFGANVEWNENLNSIIITSVDEMLAIFSSLAYNSKDEVNTELSNYSGWEYRQLPETRDNLSCSVFQKDNMVVFAFRGTPFPEINWSGIWNGSINWSQTLGYYLPATNSFNSKHAQYNSLLSMLKDYLYPYLRDLDKNIYITGHSLGGWLALESYLAIKGDNSLSAIRRNNINKVVTFNSIGVSQYSETAINQLLRSPNNITEIKNYYVCCDIARWAGEDSGFRFPGKSFKIEEIHEILGVKSSGDGSFYEHANEFSVDEVKQLFKEVVNIEIAKWSPLSSPLEKIWHRLWMSGMSPRDSLVRVVEIRIDAHTKYAGLLKYAE